MGSTPPEDDPDGPDSNGSDGDADAPEQEPTGSDEPTDREPGAESGGANDASDGDDEDPFEWGSAEDTDEEATAATGDEDATAPATDEAGRTTGEATSLSEVEQQSGAGGEGVTPETPVYSSWVDWLVGIVIALGGLLTGLVGAAFLALRSDIIDEIETEIENEGIEPQDANLEDYTVSEIVDAVDVGIVWFGAGTLLVGLAIFAAGVAYIVMRRKARRGEDTRISETQAHAFVGAITGLLLSFIPLSEAIGGAVSGYLENGIGGSSLRAGALSGVIAIVPVLLLGIVFGIAATIGLSGIGEAGYGIVLLVTIVISLLLAMALSAGLGAVGGWLGGKIAEDG